MKLKFFIALLSLLLPLLGGCEARRGRADPAATEPTAATEAEAETDAEPETETTEPETAPTEEETEPAAEDAKAAAEALLAALQTGEPDLIRDQIDYRNFLLLDDGSPENSLLAILRKLTYETLDVSADGNAAEVTVSISNVDIASFFRGYLQQMMTFEYENAGLPEEERATREELDERSEQLFFDMLDENEANRTEATIVLRLSRSGDSWRARVSPELREAATGGYFAAREQASMNMGV